MPDMNRPVSSSSVLPLTSEALEKLLNRASLARRLATAIPSDPMALRLAQIAEELDAEIDRQVQIITSSDCRIQPMHSEDCTLDGLIGGDMKTYKVDVRSLTTA
jgi:phage FluMu protein gp41